ncbi:MAG: tetratricopeptide repeat protein [Piscinibacter sp.]|uniref:tetratricopeptide repeat protein n=1 Tax=Piscinibacter sp. TaxID=1903157 RepID=UPI002582BEFA|nr:tetratricopeptide repeat protein [Piscinibacter sp.]MCW5664583.1 tetratricopeptide repeat protein [Piscinibacter sp.]
MDSLQIFLSAVSAEFETYRAALARDLSARGRSVVIQEDFAASGTPTLDKLAGYVATCDVVVHLIGDLAGASAQPRSVAALRQLYPDFGERFPALRPHLQPGGPALSYTQWEAWLGLYHGKPIIVAVPEPGAPRGPRHGPPGEADRASQAWHRDALKAQECHAEIRFDGPERLAIELHRALAGATGGEPRPTDLPSAAGHFVGRAEALADLERRLRTGQDVAVVGAAGFGKTALAARALRRIVGERGERLGASPWPDGIVLLDLYVHQGQADPAWHALADRLRGADYLPEQAARVRAAQAAKDRRVLIVVEGAEQADGQDGRVALPDLQQPLGSACRWLVLTRLLRQTELNRRVWLTDRLADDEAGELLDQLTGSPLPDDLRGPVLRLLQGHPLALTWAGKLLARGDEDPRWLLREWQAGQLPSLADPAEARHTLAWLFDRSVSRLDDGARDVLSVAGCLAPIPVALAAFEAALGRDERMLRDGLRALVQHGLMRLAADPALASHWEFGHALAYGHARQRHPAPPQVPVALAQWLQQSLNVALGVAGELPSAAGASACLEHAAALLKGAEVGTLWHSLLSSLLYGVCDRLMALGWSAQVAAGLAAVAAGLDTLKTVRGEDATLEREIAVVRNREADLHLLQGDLAGAEQAYRAALAVAERLAKADPSNAEWQRDLSISQDHIGRVLSAQGDLAGAEQAYRAALALCERLAKADPSNAEWQRDLSISQDNIGRVLSAQGDLAGAEQAYRAALALRERLAKADPSNAQWQRDLSISQNNIGGVLSAQGDLAGAEQAYRAALAVAERLAKADPSNAEWQRDLSISQDHIGRVLSAQGDLAGAEQAYRAALALCERLAKADPSNAEWQRDLSISQDNIGRVLSAQGDLAGAEQAYRAALALRERLAKADPSNAQWQRDLSISQNNIGGVLSAQGDLAGAEQAYRAALAVAERLAKADPSNAEWQRDLSISQDHIGRVLSAQGDLAGAEQAYRAALALCERLAKADPSNAEWQRDLSISQDNIGRVLSAQGDLAGAEQAYRAALALRERLAKADPSNAQWQRDLSISQNNIGGVLSAQGDLAGAEQAYRAALALRERLAKADPSNALWQRDLSFTLTNVAETLERRGQNQEALRLAERSLALDERLAALDPLNSTWQKDVEVSRALVRRLGG